MVNVQIKTLPIWSAQAEFRKSTAKIRGFFAGRGAGKALALDTLVPTPSGWSTMGDLMPGDVVFDDLGKPCNVIAATEVMHDHDCYELEFDNGEIIVADADHQWVTVDRATRKAYGRRVENPKPRKQPQCQKRLFPRIVTSADIAKTLRDGNTINHAVFPAPVPPYTLGAWLGDGHSAGALITGMDKEVFDGIAADGYVVSPVKCSGTGKAATYSFLHKNSRRFVAAGDGQERQSDSCTAVLKSNYLWKNKHVPKVYLRASAEQRMSILRGLMDTDGCVDSQGRCEFTSTKEAIAQGAFELACSLGQKATLRVGRAKLKGKDCGPKYRVFFTAQSQVFTIGRKAERVQLDKNDKTKYRYIVRCDKVASVPVRCIQVDSPSSLFLVGKTLIPTHNSKVASIDILRRARNEEPWMAVAPNHKSVIETAFPTFLETCRYTGQYIRDVLTPIPKIIFATETGGQANIVFRSGDNPEDLRGPSKAGLWYDEAGVMPKAVLENGLPILRWRGRGGPLIITTTPRGVRHWTFELFFTPVEKPSDKSIAINGRYYDPRPNTFAVNGRTIDNPFAPADFYDTIRNNYTSAFAEQELEGNFVDIAGLMFRRDWFKMVNDVPRDCMRVRCFDMASTEGGGDWTVGALVAMDQDQHFYIEDVVRGQWGPAEKEKKIRECVEKDAARYDHQVLTFIEQEGGSAGKDVIYNYIRDLSGFSVYKYPFTGQRTKTVNGEKLPGQAKITRAAPFAAQAEIQNVYMKRAAWNGDLLDEMEAFPFYVHDDQVDAVAMAVQLLRNNHTPDPGEILRGSPETSAERFGTLTAVQQATERRWESLSWLNQSTNSRR